MENQKGTKRKVFSCKFITGWKVVFSRVLIVIDVTDEAVTSKKYILRYTRKVVFSRVLGSRFFANSFFIVFSYLLNSFLIVFSKFSQSYFIVIS